MPTDKYVPTGDSEANPDPPDSLQDALRAFSVRATSDVLEFTQRLNALRDQFDGTPLAGGESSAASDRPRREAGEALYEAARMQLKIANELLNFGQSQADFWLDRLQRAGISMLPREQRPPVRLVCHELVTNTSGEHLLRWPVFVFNAAHESRIVTLNAHWRSPHESVACALRFNVEKAEPGASDERASVIPARTQREVQVYLPWQAELAAEGPWVADVEARMSGSTLSATAGIVIGRLEFVASAEAPYP